MNFDNTQISFEYKSNKQLKKAQLLFKAMGNSTLSKLGIALTQWAFKIKLPIKGIVKSTIYEQFCGGETLQEAAHTANELNKYGVSVIMDYGVEGKSDEEEFEKTVNSFIETIRFSADKTNIPFISLKVTGFARFELLEKVHNDEPLSESEQQEAYRIMHRIDTICNEASKHNKMILIDAEESWIQQPVDDLADSMMLKYNKEKAVVYNTFQLYRHDRLEFLKKSHQQAVNGGYKLGAKLVRGAYMEKERFRAAQYNYESPIQANKENTDKDFNLAVDYCLNNIDTISLFVGTHNEWSCIKATEIMSRNNISKNAEVYFSQLYGMSDNISFNMAKAGYKVSKYLPYGPVADVIPYLMRRAQENTSVSGQTSRELALINKEIKRRKSE